MNNMKNFLSTILLFVFLFSISICTTVEGKSTSYVNDITLSSTDITVYVNEQSTVNATVSVVGYANKGIVASSNNTKVATVSSKLDKSNVSSIFIKGKSIGNAVVTVRSYGKTVANKYCYKKINVTVKKHPAKPTEIKIDNTLPNVLYSGEQVKLNAQVSPNDALNKKVTWKSSNSYIASVDSSGLVTAKTAGIATITAYTANTKVYATSKVRVNQVNSYIPNGTYSFKLKDVNYYIDHQGGTTHNTNVHLWNGDGYSNNNQKINVQRIDDSRYHLLSFTAPSLMIDVNRGSNYSDPIRFGLNIDLWENNDWQAQEWFFTKSYDGYYSIRLNSYQSGAITVYGVENGANIAFEQYNPEYNYEKWQLINQNESQKEGWICNTSSTSKIDVLYGPDANYLPIGCFAKYQKITVLGDKIGEWYKVKGNSKADGGLITGYIHSTYVTQTKPPVKKLSQTISAKSFNKYYGDKPFNLGAKAKTKFTYKSSNTKIATVSSNGNVSIKGLGKVTITIVASPSSKYNSATKKITINVKLKPINKNSIRVKKLTSTSLKVYWPKVSSANGYHIKVATVVKSRKITNEAKMTKTNVLLKNATKGQKVNFSIRTYKKVGKKIYYSSWYVKNIVVK